MANPPARLRELACPRGLVALIARVENELACCFCHVTLLIETRARLSSKLQGEVGLCYRPEIQAVSFNGHFVCEMDFSKIEPSSDLGTSLL
jgi:hypothetical protein